MKSTLVFNLLVVVALLASTLPVAAMAQPAAAPQALSVVEPQSAATAPIKEPIQPPTGADTKVTTATDAVLEKLDSDLRAMARSASNELVFVRIAAESNRGFEGVVKAVPRSEPDVITGLDVWYGQIETSKLAKLASLGGVARVDYIELRAEGPRYRDPDQAAPQVTEEMRARLRNLRDNPPSSPTDALPQPEGWWDIGPGHESRAAWEKGYTGDGVRVAVIDSGVDFAHPDLQGTWAVYQKPAGAAAYYDYFVDWPVAFSPASNYWMVFDYFFNGTLTNQNTFSYGNSNFADTRATGTGSVINFNGVYTTSGTAHPNNPIYHIGYHPDRSLEVWWWEDRVGVLVVDEDGDMIYDTVYVDLNHNHDFSDDKPANKADPLSYWDADLDGYPDLSGGLVYFIADGVHWPQGVDWWWGWALTQVGNPKPGNGELVAFMFSNAAGGGGGNHGQLCASAVAGQGRIDGDPSIYPGTGEARPAWKPSGVGGMVQGGGKDAKIIAVGDAYILFESSTEDAWYFSAYGVDGDRFTDDGAHVASNSYGSSATDNDEWDARSRIVAYLNTRTSGGGAGYGANLAFLFSTGNGAPGYGTSAPPSPSTGIAVGASTQMGSTGWDSIAGPDQIVWGDVIPWSNRGPSAAGHLAPHVTADGAFAAGSLALNERGDGWTAWETWGGTSRSAPIAAGNLALIYDAWKTRTGVWPTWQQAREVFMNGATDQKSDVLVQGAGAINADTSTDIAGGLYGLNITPASWYPGSYRGADYPAFTSIITPGGSDRQVFTAYNNGPVTITAPLTTTYLTKISSFEFTLDADLTDESSYDFARPDYLFDVAQYAPAGIPADTDLMVAEFIQPFDQFASGNTALGNNWRLLWYSHKDTNYDGNLWSDANGNSVVNSSEIDAGEYVRFTYNYNWHTYHQASVKEPLARWKDGIYLGLQHRNRSAAVPVTNIKLRVTMYKKSAWDWLTLSGPSFTVNPTSNATFVATATVPVGAPYGVYEGAVQVNIPGDATHEAYVTVLPVVINVAFSGDVTAAPITLGGTPKANTPYDNAWVSGSQDWSWRAESGDWRFFFLDQTTPAPGANLVVRDEWGDAAPETDLDTLLYGPYSDQYCQSRNLRYCFTNHSLLQPAFFGPYSLEWTGGSPNMYVGSGVWAFNTFSGGNVDVVAAPLYEGLNALQQHTVRFEGDKFEVPFTKTVTTLSGPTWVGGAGGPLHYTNYFTDDISFSANVTHTGGLTVAVYGKSEASSVYHDTILQDPTSGDYCDWSNGGVWTTTTSIAGVVSELGAHVYVGGNDLDLYLLYDSDSDGFQCPGDVMGSSTNGSGTDDEVVVAWPESGAYMVLVQGWDVGGGASPFDLDVWRVDLDNSLAYRNADLSIGPHKAATFELYNVNPDACAPSLQECNDGIMFFGVDDGLIFQTDVSVDYVPLYDLSTSDKTVNAAQAASGDVLTYTITLRNLTPVTATGVLVTDVLPAQVTFGGIVTGGAAYDGGLNAVLWNGDVKPGPLVYNSTDVPLGPFDLTTVTSTLTIADSATISDVNVILSINHTYDSDLNIYLVAPDGTTVDLSIGNGGSGDNYVNTIFDDQAATSITAGAPPFTGRYQPEGLLSALAGKNTAGVWSLRVVDTFGGDSGTITAWGLLINEPASWPSIVYTATVNGGLLDGTLIENWADLNNALGYVYNLGPAQTVVYNGADLSASNKLVDKTWAVAGDVLEYTVDIVNSSSFTASGARLTDTLPAEVTFGGVVTGGATYDGGLNAVLWTGDIPPASGSIVTYTATSVPKPIGPSRSYTSSVQSVPDAFIVSDINVGVWLSHTGDSDVDMYLFAPDGTRVELSSDNGGSGDHYINTIFDDQAATAITAGAAPFTGRYRPEKPLSVLNGINAAGNWQLAVEDDSGNSSGGTLNAWWLELTEGGTIHRIVYTATVNSGLLNDALVENYATLDNNTGTVLEVGPANVLAKNVTLSSAKWVNSPTALPGDTLTYTLNLANDGLVAATGVKLTDTLPAELTFGDIVTGGATYSPALNAVLWEGDFDIGTHVYRSSDVPLGPFDYATVTSTLPVADSFILADVDVMLSISQIKSTDLDIYLVAPDGTVVELGTDNGGASGADYINTIFDDEASTPITAGSAPYTGRYRPEGLLSVLDGKNAAGVWRLRVYDDFPTSWATIIDWQLMLKANNARSIVYTATVNSVSVGTMIENYADVDDGMQVTTFGPARTTVIGTNLAQSTKLVSADEAMAGDVLTYTIVVRNTGLVTATGALMSDPIPGEIGFGGIVTGGATYTGAPTRTVEWTGDVAPGGAHTIVFTATVKTGLPDGARILNLAEVDDGAGNTWQTNYGNPTLTTVRAANLSTSSKVVEPNSVESGATTMVTFTVSVVNSGGAAADAVMEDTLPAGMTLAGAPVLVEGPGAVLYAGDTITWTGTLEAGYDNTQAVIRFAAQLTPTACNPITNLATLEDGQGNTHEISATVSVVCLARFTYHDLEDVVQNGEAIYLAGSFNGWVPTATLMAPNVDYSVFTAALELADGGYEYKYVVYTDTAPSGPANWSWLQSNNRSVNVVGGAASHDYRNIEPAYYVLQWPYATTTTVGVATENIYGQVWADDLTQRAGEPRALQVELGYGVAADPAAWATWAAMTWGSQQGNNDEYMGTITPTAVGVYSYAVRFNGNWGVGNPNDAWYYGDANWDSAYNPADAGVLTVLSGCEPVTGVNFDWSPLAPTTGEAVLFTATYTPANAGLPVTFTWNLDGSTITGNPVYHTFTLSDTYTVLVTATNGCGQATQSHAVVVTGQIVTPTYGVELTPPTAANSGAPGATLLYTLTVHNTGNTADTFDLTYADINGWTTSVLPASVNLPIDGTAQVIVTVDIPSGANNGNSDTVTVTVTSQGDGSKSDSSVLTTTAVVGCIPVSSADFGFSPTAPQVGQAVAFTGSYAPLGAWTPVTYTWNFGDGSAAATGQTVNHTFPVTNVAQTFTVTLTVDNVCAEPAVAIEKQITIRPLYIFLPLIVKNY